MREEEYEYRERSREDEAETEGFALPPDDSGVDETSVWGECPKHGRYAGETCPEDPPHDE